MRAKRKPIDASQPAPAQARLPMVRLVLPETSSKQVQILGRGAEAAPAVVEILQSIGVV
jgi:electron transfer flavoprotein beta subunit